MFSYSRFKFIFLLALHWQVNIFYCVQRRRGRSSEARRSKPGYRNGRVLAAVLRRSRARVAIRMQLRRLRRCQVGLLQRYRPIICTSLVSCQSDLIPFIEGIRVNYHTFNYQLVHYFLIVFVTFQIHNKLITVFSYNFSSLLKRTVSVILIRSSALSS